MKLSVIDWPYFGVRRLDAALDRVQPMLTDQRLLACRTKATSSRRTPKSLVRFCFLQKQIVPLSDYPVSGIKPIDDFEPITTLDSQLNLTLCEILAVCNKHDLFSTVVQHG